MAYVELKDVKMKKHIPFENHRESYLPEGKTWELVWADEFDGNALDETKWNFRTHFWGIKAPNYTNEGVEVSDGTLKINLIRDGDIFKSAHLQTGSLTFDMPRDSDRFYPFGKRQPAKFMHKYGYYEICCKLPKHDGWHAAFWLQSPSIGAHPDPSVAGVECDIMENYRQHTENLIVCGNGWDGYGKDQKWFGHYAFDYVETDDGWHYYGVDWSPEGYIFYADGKEVGRQMAPECAVSNVEEFILVSTETHGYLRNFDQSGEAGTSVRVSKPVSALYSACPDVFEVDFVRVYDAK